MALVTDISVSIRATLSKALDLSTISDPLVKSIALALTNGTGSGSADLLYHDTITIADGASDATTCLEDGSMNDSFGDALVMLTLKALIITNGSADASLHVGGAQGAEELPIFGDPTADYLIIPPGGSFVWLGGVAGIDITSAGEIKLAHDGTGTATMAVEIIAIGSSA